MTSGLYGLGQKLRVRLANTVGVRKQPFEEFFYGILSARAADKVDSLSPGGKRVLTEVKKLLYGCLKERAKFNVLEQVAFADFNFGVNNCKLDQIRFMLEELILTDYVFLIPVIHNKNLELHTPLDLEVQKAHADSSPDSVTVKERSGGLFEISRKDLLEGDGHISVNLVLGRNIQAAAQVTAEVREDSEDVVNLRAQLAVKAYLYRLSMPTVFASFPEAVRTRFTVLLDTIEQRGDIAAIINCLREQNPDEVGPLARRQFASSS